MSQDLRRPGRRAAAIVALALALAALAVLSLVLGTLGTPLGELPQALVGLLAGEGPFVLRQLRAPRLATAIAAGGALGLAGALFQRASSNPLVTPDVLGITTAAGAGVALARLAGAPAWLGAIGGATTAVALILLASGGAVRTPGRVIVAGIGVAAGSAAIIQLVLVWSRQSEALAIASALAGNLTARGWDDAALAWAALVPCGLAALTLRRDLLLLELGDDAAHGLGSRPQRTRAAAFAIGVALTAAAVSAAGPVAFIALMAPQLARWATGRAAMGSAALVGAILTLAADLATQHLTPLDGLPVGIVTALVGGAFLAVRLAADLRRGTL